MYRPRWKKVKKKVRFYTGKLMFFFSDGFFERIASYSRKSASEVWLFSMYKVERTSRFASR